MNRNRDEILTFEEIAKVVSFWRFPGIDKLTITGGEPLTRFSHEKRQRNF